MRQVYSTVNNRCRRNTLHQCHEGNTIDRLSAGSQLGQKTLSPDPDSSTPSKDALMSSKGGIGIKRRYLSHSQPTNSNHIQSTVYSNKPKPISNISFNNVIICDSYIRGIHAEVISTSDEEKVEIFSWSGVRMVHLIDTSRKFRWIPLLKKGHHPCWY